jgi:uncharacterized protein (TIGR02597 family)
MARGWLFCGLVMVLACNVPAQSLNEISGFMTLKAKGTGGTGPSSVSFIAIGLSRPAAYQSTISAVGPSTLTDLTAVWSDNQFNGRNGRHYVEITSGPKAGYTTEILGTDAAGQTLQLTDDLSGAIPSGETFTVRKYWTIATLFGAHDESGVGGGSILTADEILIYQPASRSFRTYFYKTIGLGGTGWRSTASASTDEAEAKLDLTQGIIIRRKQPGDLSWKIFGVARSCNTIIEVQGGLNLLANVYPAGTLTLGNSQLYTGDPSTGLADGSILTADKVLIYDGSAYETFYYKTAGLGGTGWRSTASASTDASGTIIPNGSSVLVQRTGGRSGFFWILQPQY